MEKEKIKFVVESGTNSCSVPCCNNVRLGIVMKREDGTTKMWKSNGRKYKYEFEQNYLSHFLRGMTKPVEKRFTEYREFLVERCEMMNQG